MDMDCLTRTRIPDSEKKMIINSPVLAFYDPAEERTHNSERCKRLRAGQCSDIGRQTSGVRKPHPFEH